MTQAVPEGYRLHVTTWENDGDHYQSNAVSGLTKEDVEFYVSIIKQFGCRYGSRRFSPGLGNEEIAIEQLLSIVKDAIDNHPGLSSRIQQKYNICFDPEDYAVDVELKRERAEVIYDELSEIFGTTVDYEDIAFFMRVVEDFTVVFTRYDTKDMTEKFK